jgi:hypothetical protein
MPLPEVCKTFAPWGRVYAKLRHHMEGVDERYRTYGGEISDADFFHQMVSITAKAIGLGKTSPFDTPFYEAAQNSVSMSERKDAEFWEAIDELKARVRMLAREEFFRNLKEMPPPKGQRPNLPRPDFLDEAKRRFPEIYGSESEAD